MKYKTYPFYNNYKCLNGKSRFDLVDKLVELFDEETVINKLNTQYQYTHSGIYSEAYFHSWLKMVIQRKRNNRKDVVCWSV